MLSAFASYTVEKKIAKDPSQFGKGAIQGVAGPEAANNAGAQTSFIPLLTLGIPANAVMALMVGAMTIHNIQPGPQVMTRNPELFWGLIAAMWIGNLMLVVLNLPLIGIWVKLLTVPYRLLYPAILLFCCIGVYTHQQHHASTSCMTAVFGLLGCMFVKLDCEPAPLLLGFVLGPMMEENLRRALLLSRGDPTVFVTRPMSAVMLLIAAALLLLIIALPNIRKKREEAFQEHAACVCRNERHRMAGARAALTRFDWSLPYPSRRQPIFARNVVATSQPLATQAGIAMLARGGNAVDAALATAITLTVVEPCSNGIGCDLFAILWDGSELVGLNASGRAPAARDAGALRRHARAMPERGWETVTIPGACPAGARCRSASASCRSPTCSSPRSATRATASPCRRSIAREMGSWPCRTMPQRPRLAEHFLPRGRAPQPGERFAARAMAATLEKIARTRRRGVLSRRARAGDGRSTRRRTAARTRSRISPRTPSTG